MKVSNTAHTFQVRQAGISLFNRNRMKPSSTRLVHPEPDIMHRLKRSIGGLELTNLKMTITMGINEGRLRKAHPKTEDTSLIQTVELALLDNTIAVSINPDLQRRPC